MQEEWDYQHTFNKWTPITEIYARGITSTTIMGRSEQKGNRHM